MSDETAGAENRVRHFRQILLWPLQLAPRAGRSDTGRAWEQFRPTTEHPWRETEGALPGDPDALLERHYAEFVTFLPYVQRFLYGESGGGAAAYGASPIRIFARDDVAQVRITLHEGQAPLDLEVSHVHLYFFFDIDVVIPVVEVAASDLSLAQAQDLLFRFGRAYPAFWHADGRGGRCPVAVEWLSRTGAVLARSDYERRERYLSTVARSRTPCIASHWEWLLRPMLPEHAEPGGELAYRHVEYYRMPLLGYLAFDDPGALSRSDFVSLGLVTGPAERGDLPSAASALERFETEYCYDRYWAPRERHGWSNTRIICSGHTFLMIGRSGDRFFVDAETGLLGQFRRQYFLLGLIAHFQKAALLMLSDRLVVALADLTISDVESIKRFKRRIRRAMETFLRFTHRYWFQEVSTQDQAREIFGMWRRHLGTERLYAEVREEIQDMSGYLANDSLRRQANTVVRLTVVTTLGLIATVVTGVLGMNIFAGADDPWYMKLLYVAMTLAPTTLLILLTIYASKALAAFLESLSERQPEPSERPSTRRSDRSAARRRAAPTVTTAAG